MAAHLAAEGATVRRLPHLLVPLELLADRGAMRHADFQITWNNVVLERAAAGCAPKASPGGLASGDAEARRVFAAAGCRLDLLPPLPSSIVLQGGYRCASNHSDQGGQGPPSIAALGCRARTSARGLHRKERS